MKKTIGILLVLIGIGLFSYPFYMEWQQNKEVRAIEQALQLIENADGEEVDLSAIENLTVSETSIRNVLELEIPSIDMRHKVLDESTEENLNLALTQIKQNQTPGEGNFTIAGHRGYRDGRHFSKLDKVPIGEIAYLHTKDHTYAYEIYSTEVIAATAVEVLEDAPGKKELTLITCTVSGKERVAVKGKLIKTVKKDN